MNIIKEKAYAKINLFLDVLGIRADGFHEIKTVMHTVSLCDEVQIEVTPSRVPSVRLICEGNAYLPQDSRNIAYRAAELFLNSLGINAAVLIKLQKRIPVAAGLAGGSTDAAAVLRGLNRIFKRPFARSELCRLGATLGSDVPYCIMGKTALCTGRGEVLEYPFTEPHIYTVVAIGNEFISTADAYSALDGYYNSFSADNVTGGREYYRVLENALGEGSVSPDGLFNAFEAATLPRCEGARELKRLMSELSATGALMSGSGPSVFGIFPTSELAAAAEKRLIELGYTAFYAETV